ncbi:MAG: hypothetical protein R3F49_02470 [Planctomycetota bacterium]
MSTAPPPDSASRLPRLDRTGACAQDARAKAPELNRLDPGLAGRIEAQRLGLVDREPHPRDPPQRRVRDGVAPRGVEREARWTHEHPEPLPMAAEATDLDGVVEPQVEEAHLPRFRRADHHELPVDVGDAPVVRGRLADPEAQRVDRRLLAWRARVKSCTRASRGSAMAARSPSADTATSVG